MRIELYHLIEILIGSMVFYLEIGYLNKITSFKGKYSFSLKKLIGNSIYFFIKPRQYYVEGLFFVFIALASSFLIIAEGKLQQIVLLFSIADLVVNQKHTSLAHLSNTLLICIFIGFNNFAPISLLFVQFIFFILYAINTGRNLRLVSIASQLVFFLSCLNSFNFSVEYLIVSKAILLLSFPVFYLLVLHFLKSTPALKPFKLDNIMWILVMLGSLKGFI